MAECIEYSKTPNADCILKTCMVGKDGTERGQDREKQTSSLWPPLLMFHLKSFAVGFLRNRANERSLESSSHEKQQQPKTRDLTLQFLI